jgi:2-polyprenyl-3-methyl-5-hydroxy-6-metoxy-1,4-benzoquinol methylase
VDQIKAIEKPESRLNFEIDRGETQKGVNAEVLKLIIDRFPRSKKFSVLDLPCGTGLFLSYLKKLYSEATLKGADIKKPKQTDDVGYIKMDLSKEFPLTPGEKFDLITSISGVMMFGNTSGFIENCEKHLSPGGTFIVTNDNSATIIDKLFFLFLGRPRLFKPFYQDTEGVTQNIPIQELYRLLRINGLVIETIKFTSIYNKDLIFLPFGILIYPIHQLYLSLYKPKIPNNLIKLMFPFRHYFCRHYIIVASKKRE